MIAVCRLSKDDGDHHRNDDERPPDSLVTEDGHERIEGPRRAERVPKVIKGVPLIGSPFYSTLEDECGAGVQREVEQAD